MIEISGTHCITTKKKRKKEIRKFTMHNDKHKYLNTILLYYI